MKPPRAPDPERTIPVVRESVEVTRARHPSGVVRVHLETHERTQALELREWHDHYDIEHVPIDRPAEHREAPRQDGDVLVIPVYEERVILQRQLVLKEELRLRKRHEQTTRHVEVPLREQQVRVERESCVDQRLEDEGNSERAAGPLSPSSERTLK